MLAAPSTDTSPGTLGRICPGGQADMAHFLQVPAKDLLVSIEGFVQSRNNGFGRRMKSFYSRLNYQGGVQKV